MLEKAFLVTVKASVGGPYGLKKKKRFGGSEMIAKPLYGCEVSRAALLCSVWFLRQVGAEGKVCEKLAHFYWSELCRKDKNLLSCGLEYPPRVKRGAQSRRFGL